MSAGRGGVPQVSVVMPVFNRTVYLDAAIGSVFAQRFQQWELIVVDDGSDAETLAHLAHIERDPRVRVLRRAHTGRPAAARNAGWRVARGHYIAFLDSDDIWMPAKLELQIESLARQPQCRWSNSAFRAVDAAGRALPGSRGKLWPAQQGWIFERLIAMQGVLALPSVIVERTLLEEVDGFDEGQRMCEDYELWLRLSRLSPIDGIDAELLHIRRHNAHFGSDALAFEDRDRVLRRLLAGPCDEALRRGLRKERAKVAAGLAQSHAMFGRRRDALSTVYRSGRYAWRHREWWRGCCNAFARAMVPRRVQLILRSLRRRARLAPPAAPGLS